MKNEEQKYDISKLLENPVNFVNTHFPDEYCLSGLDALIKQISNEIKRQDESLVKIIQDRAISFQSAHEKFEQLQLGTNELIEQIEDVKKQTLRGETSLNILSADIRELHRAKINICETIVALKRLLMLTTTLEDLSVKARERRYDESTGLVLVLCDLKELVKPLVKSAPVAKLVKKCDMFLDRLTQQLLEDLEILLGLHGAIDILEDEVNIEAACSCADAIGASIRTRIAEMYASHVTKSYQSIFPLGIDVRGLDTINQRFSWLRRCINEFDEKYGEFVPPSWGLQPKAAASFIEVLSAEVIERLTKSHDVMGANAVLSALLKCREFEQELDSRFSHTRDTPSNPPCMAVVEFPEVLGETKQRVETTQVRSFSGSLSRCFESYLGPWIASEEAQMSELMNRIMTGPSSEETLLLVLCSAKELFSCLNERLKLTLTISFEQTLYEMFLVFKRMVSKYQQHLQDRLGKIDHQTDFKTIAKVTGCVVATSDYCLETLEHLAECIITSIAAAYRDLINFATEREKYAATKADAIKLYLEKCTKFEPLASAKVEHVIDASDQIVANKKLIIEGIRLVKNHYPSLYLAYLVNKVARALVTHVKNCIFAMTTATDAQCQQLLLDVYEARLILLENIKEEIGTFPSGYVETVTGEMEKLQTLARVLNSTDQFAGSYNSLLIENGGPCTKEELDLIFSIKKTLLVL